MPGGVVWLLPQRWAREESCQQHGTWILPHHFTFRCPFQAKWLHQLELFSHQVVGNSTAKLLVTWSRKAACSGWALYFPISRLPCSPCIAVMRMGRSHWGWLWFPQSRGQQDHLMGILAVLQCLSQALSSLFPKSPWRRGKPRCLPLDTLFNSHVSSHEIIFHSQLLQYACANLCAFTRLCTYGDPTWCQNQHHTLKLRVGRRGGGRTSEDVKSRCSAELWY